MYRENYIESLRTELVEIVEKLMKKAIGQKQEFVRTDLDVNAAIKKLNEIGDETYKVQNVTNLKERGETKFSIYQNGNFIDLCEGPHVKHTGELPAKAFKLDRIAGAYWLGDEKNKMLTRIYGLAYETREELDEYIKRRKIAEEFDHRKLGAQLDLYQLEEIVGKGLPLWLPNGTVIRDEIENFAKEKEYQYGYKRVATPHISKADLYHKSGHFVAYKDSMFPPMVLEDEGKKTEYYLKPMNCPHHHLIYAARLRSYRELPLRLAEYGTVYRYEQSGELSGLIRVRCMSMNDAHIYIRKDQFEDEFRSIMKMYMEFFDVFKLKEYEFRLSVRGEEESEKFIGEAKIWKEAEELLTNVMDDMKIDYYVGEGEAAFYGPKLDIQFKSLMGREETVSTIQVDFLAAQKFDLKYIDESGAEQKPVVIHRAPLSTHERFVSFLIEYYGGAFPTWCAPTQVCLIPINEECNDYADKLAEELDKNFIRVQVDKTDNSFNKKIRTNTVHKIPILLIIGNKEVADDKVTVRRYGIKEQQTVKRDDFIKELKQEIKDRVMLREPMGSII